ncbi:MAG TPA: phage holin family protein [Marmoricola sp.]|jgi:hypothetical protein
MAHREPVVEEEPTIGKLVVDASRDISTLVQHEIALAKSELRVSMKAGGMSMAMFAAAAFFGVMSLIMLSWAIAYLIHFTGLDLAWCFGIVFLFYLLVAGVLALIGYRKAQRVEPPRRAIAQAQETRTALTTR